MTVSDAVEVAQTEAHRPSGPRPKRHVTLRKVLMFVAPAVGLLLLFTVWELYVRAADVRPIVLPEPSNVIRHVWEERGFYWRNAKVTMAEAGMGFSLAFIFALVIATFMAHSRFIERATFPVIVLLQSTPVAALAPVFVIGFGFRPWQVGIGSFQVSYFGAVILVAALFAFVPFVTNAFTGLRAIDPNTYELLRSVKASRREIFVKLRFPHALPYLFAAARICIGLALVGAVIGEAFGGSTSGLGNALRVGQTRSLADQLWGSVFVLAFIGVFFTLLLTFVESRVLKWHSSQSLLD
jgi:NitT/TauT family transport system permease protein